MCRCVTRYELQWSLRERSGVSGEETIGEVVFDYFYHQPDETWQQPDRARELTGISNISRDYVFLYFG